MAEKEILFSVLVGGASGWVIEQPLNPGTNVLVSAQGGSGSFLVAIPPSVASESSIITGNAVVELAFEEQASSGPVVEGTMSFTLQVTATCSVMATHGATGMVSIPIPFSFLADAGRGVSGYMATAPLISFSAIALTAAVADVVIPIPISFSATAGLGVAGSVSAAVTIPSLDMSASGGFGATGDMSAFVPFAVIGSVSSDITGSHGAAGQVQIPLPIVVEAEGDRGVAGEVVIPLPLGFSATGGLGNTGSAEIHLPIQFSAVGDRGVSGAFSGEVNFVFTLDAVGGHGVSGVFDASVASGVSDSVDALVMAARGASAVASFRIPISADMVGAAERYEVVGQVRLNGGLVDRIIRVHSVATGELLGSGMTQGGHFRIHAGFVHQECYILPIDGSVGATDFFPPCSNHVMNIPAGS